MQMILVRDFCYANSYISRGKHMQGTMQNKGVVYAGELHLLSSQASPGFSIWYKTPSFLFNVLHGLLVWLWFWECILERFYLGVFFSPCGLLLVSLLWALIAKVINLVEVTSLQPPFLNKNRSPANHIATPLAISTVCNSRSVSRPVKAQCCNRSYIKHTDTHTQCILGKIHAVIVMQPCIRVHRFK